MQYMPSMQKGWYGVFFAVRWGGKLTFWAFSQNSTDWGIVGVLVYADWQVKSSRLLAFVSALGLPKKMLEIVWVKTVHLDSVRDYCPQIYKPDNRGHHII